MDLLFKIIAIINFIGLFAMIFLMKYNFKITDDSFEKMFKLVEKIFNYMKNKNEG